MVSTGDAVKPDTWATYIREVDTMTPQQAEDWNLPYFGPTQEDCDAADALGDYQHDIERQYELDHEWRDDR